MSTHYGRMVVLDDRVLMFANPEDAAEYIGFDLAAGRGGLIMYEKDGEKYFVLDSHLHFWDASPENWVQGRRAVRQGLDRVLPRLPGPRPGRDALDARALPEVLGGRLREGRLRGRLRRHRDLPVDVPEASGTRRASTTSSRTPRCWTASPASSSSTGAGTRARARPAWRSCEADHARYGLQGVKLYTAEWHDGSRGWTLDRSRGRAVPRAVPGARHQEHPRPQGADDLAAGQGRLRRHRRRPSRRRASRSSTSSSSTSGCRGSRTSASWRRRSPTSTPACRSSSAASCTPARGSSRRSWASCCSGSARTRCCSAATTRIWEPKWQIEGLVDWDYPDDTFSDYPRWTTAAKKKVLGLNAAQAVRHRGARGAAARRRRRNAGRADDAQLVEGAA